MNDATTVGVTTRLGLLSGAAALASLPIRAGAIFMGPATIESLQARQTEQIDAAQAIIDAADAEERDLSDEEIETINNHRAEAEKLGRQIDARKAVQPPQAGPQRRTAPEPRVDNRTPGHSGGTVPAQPRVNDARGGFRNFGEFAVAVRAAGQGGQPDGRLTNAATTYGGEGSGADGGFSVPGEFKRDFWTKVMAEENLLARCAPLTTGGNSMTIPKDETTPWQTSGGIQAYWESEAAQVAASKPALSMSTIRLSKLMALVPITDELLEDAPGLESWLRAKAPAKMAAKINTAIISGTGVGQPLGILKAPCTISVAAEASQAADTVLFANINKMWARMYAPCRRNAIFLINQDIEPQLNGMAFDPSATSKVPVYLPAGGVSGSPYATLFGRPVVPVEACSTLGDQGDIILADLNQYWALTKGQDVRTDVSMHLYFDQGLQAFRFTFRVNGQPAWGSSIQPQNGSLTRSCFVTLDDRP